MSFRRFAAIGLAAAVTTVTARSRADGPAVAEAPAANGAARAETPPADSSTPLGLRPSKPLTLSPEPAHSSLGWKLGAFAVLLGGAAFWVRKRQPAVSSPNASLTVLRRVPVGFRSELVIVDVEGQRLLLGVTPHSIQSLATLDDVPAEAPERLEKTSAPLEAPRPRRAPAEASLRPDFEAMLARAERGSDPERSAATAPREETAPASDDDVAGQARGLLALRVRR